MTTQQTVIALVAIGCASFGTGFILGRLYEAWQWAKALELWRK